MKQADIDHIRQELGVEIPAGYAQLMTTYGSRLRQYTYEVAGDETCWFEPELYLSADLLIQSNRNERDIENDTARLFPQWWRTFLIIGDNGGGDFFGIKLDDSPGVWMLCSDEAPQAVLECEDLEAFVEERIESFNKFFVEEAEDADPPQQGFLESMSGEEREAWEARRFEVDEDHQPFYDAIIADPEDDAARLALADHLTADFPLQAGMIRAAVALEAGIADGDAFADAHETFAAGLIENEEYELPAGFYCGKTPDSPTWQRGLPAVAAVEFDPLDAAEVTARLPALFETTPVRGLSLTIEGDDFQPVLEILRSEEATQLNYLELHNLHSLPGGVHPVIVAICRQELAGSLLGWKLHGGLLPHDTAALGAAPFDRLQLAVAAFTHNDPAIYESDWFARMKRFSPSGLQAPEPAVARRIGKGLVNHATLHSFQLHLAPELEPVTASLHGARWPELRRLIVDGAGASQAAVDTLCSFDPPQLYALNLSSHLTPDQWLQVLRSPLCRKLRHIKVSQCQHAEVLYAVAEHCPQLRMLTFSWSPFEVTAGRKLSFPRLTTLEIHNPFHEEQAFTDQPQLSSAALLRVLDAPQMKHLTLSGCDLDAECLAALAANPSLTEITRLILRAGARADGDFGTAATQQLLRSTSMHQLVELEIRGYHTADGLPTIFEDGATPEICRLRTRAEDVSEETFQRLHDVAGVEFV